jgi:hypothetical protein
MRSYKIFLFESYRYGDETKEEGWAEHMVRNGEINISDKNYDQNT